jgi:hypothetical protein
MAIETIPFLLAVGRMIRAAGRRVAQADEIELGQLYALRTVLDEAIREAEDGQLASGRSLSYIASATGVSRQAVHARRARQKKRAA